MLKSRFQNTLSFSFNTPRISNSINAINLTIDQDRFTVNFMWDLCCFKLYNNNKEEEVWKVVTQKKKIVSHFIFIFASWIDNNLFFFTGSILNSNSLSWWSISESREKNCNLSVRDLKTTELSIGASEGDFQLIHDDPFNINMCATSNN